jgi:riboflavin kinase/FMN adenylyltransferase
MIKKSVITVGTFDGVHKGHRLLISKVLSSAKINNLKSVVIALEQPVKKVSGLLTIFEEKLDEIKTLGVDEIVIIKVPSEIISYSPDEFFDKILCETFNISEIVYGYDFSLGKDKKGNINWLEKKAKSNDVKASIVSPLKITSEQVSSSHIRLLIKKGDIKNAAKLLGRSYSFIGMPFKEKGMGKRLGFPTVNLKVFSDKLLPRGVFMSFISHGEEIYPSVTNIGVRATFNRGEKVIPETHILNFAGLWEKLQTKVTILKKIRDEKKFTSAGALKNQIAKDISATLKFFSKDKIK